MELARESWTDARLDDFAAHTARRFDQLERRMDHGFRRVDADVRQLRDEMNARFDSFEGRFDSIDGRFDSLHRTMLLFSGSVIVSLFGVLGTLLITQA